MRRTLLIGAAAVLIFSVADAQTSPTPTPANAPLAYMAPVSSADAANLRAVLDSARQGQTDSALAARAGIVNPIARKIATWAIVDAIPEQLSFYEIDSARKELIGYPRAAKRQAAAERVIETSGMTPGQIIAWFGADDPQTARGAMALASAYRMSGQNEKAVALIRHFWRDKSFEADDQRLMLARFGGDLTADDHIRRADLLLYGAQGPATQDMLSLLPEPYRTAAEARMALRSDSPRATDLLARLTLDQQNMPGVAIERAGYLRGRGLDALALTYVRYFEKSPTPAAAERIWRERRALIASALKNGSYQAAYDAAADTGMKTGADAAEAEFYAGWIALTRLKKPALAAKHFAAVEAAGESPITQGRALYWEGRAAEAAGDEIAAKTFYGQGAKHLTTFYGQLAAEKAGLTTLDLGKDPDITAADRAAFESNEVVRAARVLAQSGARDTLRVFAMHLDDVLPNAAQQALLVDLAKTAGDDELAMRVARGAAQRGMVLPERGYPLMQPPYAPNGAEAAFVLSISRQESNFYPYARSGADARGMMQLLPSTAKLVARKIGEPYSLDRLYEPGYNMKLGSSYLGGLVDQFSGSYIMAAAGYNAGPGRPTQWTSYCGDPRGAATDPIDYIECIPFSETRNYVMRTLETTQVYRARLAGGKTPLRLSADLNRGGYGYYASNP
ncbi:MAG TPA: lytic transglycosylase domain-containing protein [Caulobacteraceae bacterium]